MSVTSVIVTEFGAVRNLWTECPRFQMRRQLYRGEVAEFKCKQLTPPNKALFPLHSLPLISSLHTDISALPSKSSSVHPPSRQHLLCAPPWPCCWGFDGDQGRSRCGLDDGLEV